MKPWTPDTAIACLQALAKTYDLHSQDGATAEIVRLLGCCIPHHVRMFFGHLPAYCMRKKITEITPGEVACVYQSEVLSTRGYAELTHYEERLKIVLGAEKTALALEMLTEAAVTGHLAADAIRQLQQECAFKDEPTAEAQKEILWLLEHDGYMTQTTNGYVFVSNFLWDWWKIAEVAKNVLKRFDEVRERRIPDHASQQP